MHIMYPVHTHLYLPTPKNTHQHNLLPPPLCLFFPFITCWVELLLPAGMLAPSVGSLHWLDLVHAAKTTVTS